MTPDEKPEQPRLEIYGDNVAEIVRGDARVQLRGGTIERIIWWYRHLTTHGAGSADIYLAGVIDGLRQGYCQKYEDMVRDRRPDECPECHEPRN